MFRFSTGADCRQIYELVCQLENTILPYEEFQSVYSEQLLDSRYYSYIYEENRQVLAFLNLRIERQLHHAAPMAEIMEFIVAPGCRGRRLGHKLLKQAAQTAQKLNCCGIEVASSRQRTDAHRLYQRNGLQPTHYKLTMSLSEAMHPLSSLK